MSDTAASSWSERADWRPPWALILAVVFLVAFECWLRSWPAARLVAYRDDAEQASAVRGAIALATPPDIAFVGSSMTYQGIAVPEIEQALSKLAQSPVRVTNDAIRGGRIDLTEAAVRAILARRTRPKLIVVGISMRDLRESGLDVDRLSEFWSLHDWWRDARLTHHWWSDALPQVVRNEVGRASWTLRFRTGIALWLESRFITATAEPMPAMGERPSQHEGSRREIKLSKNLAAFHQRTNRRRMFNTYRPQLPAKPKSILSDRVGMIIDECKQKGVKVMFLDMPLSTPLRELIERTQRKTKKLDASKDFEPEFRSAIEAWTTRAGVPFIVSDGLGMKWTNDDFYDGQHLNYNGAVKLGNAIAPKISAEMKKAGHRSSSSG